MKNQTLSALKTARKWMHAALDNEPEDFDNKALKRALAKIEKAIAQQNEVPRIIVTIEGGNYQHHHSSVPVNLSILDYDNDNFAALEQERDKLPHNE